MLTDVETKGMFAFSMMDVNKQSGILIPIVVSLFIVLKLVEWIKNKP